MPEARSQMQIDVVGDSENHVHSSQLADGKVACFVLCILQKRFLTARGRF